MAILDWNDDKFVKNAAEILSSLKARDGKFREMTDLTIWCRHCSKPRKRVIRFFAGRGDDGVVREWILTTGLHRGGTGRVTVPPQAQGSVGPGGLVWPMHTACPRCHRGWVVFPGGLPDEIQAESLPAWVVMSADLVTPDHELRPGDETTVVEVARWIQGPGTIVLGESDSPVHGALVP